MVDRYIYESVSRKAQMHLVPGKQLGLVQERHLNLPISPRFQRNGLWEGTGEKKKKKRDTHYLI